MSITLLETSSTLTVRARRMQHRQSHKSISCLPANSRIVCRLSFSQICMQQKIGPWLCKCASRSEEAVVKGSCRGLSSTNEWPLETHSNWPSTLQGWMLPWGYPITQIILWPALPSALTFAGILSGAYEALRPSFGVLQQIWPCQSQTWPS